MEMLPMEFCLSAPRGYPLAESKCRRSRHVKMPFLTFPEAFLCWWWLCTMPARGTSDFGRSST